MSEREPYKLPKLRVREKPAEGAGLSRQLDQAGDRAGFTVEDPPAKRRRGAPVRVDRPDPRRISVELAGDTYRALQLLGIERREKLQAMCEQAIEDYLRKHSIPHSPK